jgi:hypothetical protein
MVSKRTLFETMKILNLRIDPITLQHETHCSDPKLNLDAPWQALQLKWLESG